MKITRRESFRATAGAACAFLFAPLFSQASNTSISELPRILDWDLGGNQFGVTSATVHLDGVEIPHVLQIDTVAITVRWMVHDKNDQPMYEDESRDRLLRETLTGHTVIVVFDDGTRKTRKIWSKK